MKIFLAVSFLSFFLPYYHTQAALPKLDNIQASSEIVILKGFLRIDHESDTPFILENASGGIILDIPEHIKNIAFLTAGKEVEVRGVWVGDRLKVKNLVEA